MPDDFQQLLLIPPSAIEFRIRLGVVPERDHAQVQVEALEPETRAVLAMWSRAHFTISGWPEALQEAVERTNALIAEMVEPF